MRTQIAALALLAAALAACADARAQSPLCADPAEACGARIPPGCLEKLGAGAVASDDRCAPAFDAYKDCLAEAAATCAAPAARHPDAADTALAKQAYEAVVDSGDPGALELVADSFPATFWGKLAARRAKALREASATSKPRPEPKAQPTPSPAVAPARRAEPPSQPDATPLHRAAQTELRRLRLYAGPIDGDWGPGSQAAMRAFQAAAKRRQTGQIDEAALALLKAAPSPPAQEAPEVPEMKQAQPREPAPEPVEPARTKLAAAPAPKPSKPLAPAVEPHIILKIRTPNQYNCPPIPLSRFPVGDSKTIDLVGCGNSVRRPQLEVDRDDSGAVNYLTVIWPQIGGHRKYRRARLRGDGDTFIGSSDWLEGRAQVVR